MTVPTTPALGFQNWFSTTLSSGITASDTVIYLNSLPTPDEGFLVLEPDSTGNREIIFYNSKGANFVTCPSVAAGRGVGGTTAVSHSSGVTVQMNVVAEHFEALQDGTAFAVGGIGASAYEDGWAPILGVTPNTITYNGNRNYDLVFNSTDLTDTLSPGMKLKLTRTVAAPDQCADLEASSSQYFSDSSLTGMTFTDDFTCLAWLKLESYGAYGIITRYGGTTGFVFQTNSSGQIILQGLGTAGAGRIVTSYASLPLNKWVHVAATMDMSGSAGTIYFDGTLVNSSYANVGAGATALIQSGNLNIGATNGANFFDGKIAQAAVFSSVLSAATIRSYMSQGLSGSESTLVSAYSFDNAITDLNTTNANNLTANAGAAATNADSPFANAVSAGLQEYCEINSVVFSTNTTVNVRVPETCMIPTSGGITASYYAVGAYPYGLPYFSKVLAHTIMNSSVSTTSGSFAAALGLSTTCYIPANAVVKIKVYYYRASFSTNNAAAEVGIFEDSVTGNPIETGYAIRLSGIANTEVTPGTPEFYYRKPSVGSKTFAAGITTSGGTFTMDASTIRPIIMTVELV